MPKNAVTLYIQRRIAEERAVQTILSEYFNIKDGNIEPDTNLEAMR